MTDVNNNNANFVEDASKKKEPPFKRISMDFFYRRSSLDSNPVDYGYEPATPSVHLRNSAIEELSTNKSNRAEPSPRNCNSLKLWFQKLWTIETAKGITQSSKWHGIILTLVFIIIFLTHSIAKLLFNRENAYILNIILFVSGFILAIDVTLRCIATPKYFPWKCDGIHCQKEQDQSQVGNYRLRQHELQQRKNGCCGRRCSIYRGCCKFGSFDFLLDVISIISVIFSLTYTWDIPKRKTILLGTYGIPVSGLSPHPIYQIFSLRDITTTIRLVFRLGIFYRFIRHVTKLTSRFNWFGLFCKLNPFRYSALNKTMEHQHTTFHGVKLFEGTEREKQNVAAITIQTWWRDCVENGKVCTGKMKRLKQMKSTRNNFKPKIENVDQKSQIGATMENLTGQRVAQFMLSMFAITLFFTYYARNMEEEYALLILHKQTTDMPDYSAIAIQAARQNVLKCMFRYQFANGTIQNYTTSLFDESKLWQSEILNITVTDSSNYSTVGLVSLRQKTIIAAICDMILLSFILVIWFCANVAFTGPVMQLVVIPIERMIKLLRMMMTDPLGYQNSYKFMMFVNEEKILTDDTGWTSEVLKGMETTFLMSTILQISSLLKVGFGAAGVDIIRQGLEKSQTQAQTSLVLNSRGTLVKCIFLFCDIRQFTDTTECLLEEIFVFTNKVASVVHPICSAYGGSANKNVGDAFLMSWLLEEHDDIKAEPSERTINSKIRARSRLRLSSLMEMYWKNNADANLRTDADLALFAVVKILCALFHDNFILEALSEDAQNRLLEFFADRPGPLVQLGFGLHVGEAVVGAIGSQRKIDATYLSTNVDFSEFLESSTKTYGTRMLMSQEFHKCLNPNNKRRCRKVDRVCTEFEENEEDFEVAALSVKDLYTLDLDIDALWNVPKPTEEEAMSPESSDGNPNEDEDGSTKTPTRRSPKLEIPTGFVTYKESDWQTEDMLEMRKKYADFPFLKWYSIALEAFYNQNWSLASRHFLMILDRFEDGPSRYFMKKIEANNHVPPKKFRNFNSDL